MSAWDDRNAAQYDGARAYRNDSTDLYIRHNEHVEKVIPSEKLLVHRAAEGWLPICEFLGVQIPDVSYPHTNDTASLRKGKMIGATVGALVWLVLGATLAYSWKTLR